MATGATSGATAILYRVREILQDHLADTLAVILADTGQDGIVAPVTEDRVGYALSRFIPRDIKSAIRVTIDSSKTKNEFRVINCAKRVEVLLRVSYHFAHEDPYFIEEALESVSTAIQRVVLEYILSNKTNTANVYDANVSTVDRGSSIRERYGSRGLTTLGRGVESTQDTVDVVFQMWQHQAQTDRFVDS